MHVPSNYERKPNDGDSALQTPLSATRTTPSAAAPTQMIIFPIKATASIEDISTPDGQIWAGALDILEGSTGFQLRDTLFQHYTFLSSSDWTRLTVLLRPLLTNDTATFVVRHAMISDFTHNPQSLGNGAPVTGTAIYLATDSDGWEKTWALWTTIVPYAKGCLGCAGGWVVEALNGHEKGYVVWVGWESTDLHDAYHDSEDFSKKRKWEGETVESQKMELNVLSDGYVDK
ncbi:hypothetical protein MANI_025968 [Metarhizium anisopliae]|nr:hypothetical protein MANI_025968 [Metarhizium anisopliae]